MASGSGKGNESPIKEDKKDQGAEATSSSSVKSKKKKMLNASSKFIEKPGVWDPLASNDWDRAGPPGVLAATRIRRDISILYKDPLPGIFMVPDHMNFCRVHCLIVGPFETPYEGGFFHFLVRFGPSYPLHPPRVRALTTNLGRVRFNPNFYANGKVCLSILGTWSGPPWSPATNLGALLLSIQSLLNEDPYYNEPGFERNHFPGQSEEYKLYLTHETLRVSVCSRMEHLLAGSSNEMLPLPDELIPVVRGTFLDFYDHYIEKCEELKKHDGQDMKDVYTNKAVEKYQFESIRQRLKAIREKIECPSSKLFCSSETSNCKADSISSASSLSDEDFTKEVKSIKEKAKSLVHSEFDEDDGYHQDEESLDNLVGATSLCDDQKENWKKDVSASVSDLKLSSDASNDGCCDSWFFENDELSPNESSP